MPEKEEKGEGFDLSKIYIWVRGVESKLNSLRREFEVLKEDSARKQEKITKEIKTINSELMELKREGEKTREKMELIIKELKLTADKEEVEVLKKYVEFWNPINFVTQKDVERVVEEKLEKREPAKS